MSKESTAIQRILKLVAELKTEAQSDFVEHKKSIHETLHANRDLGAIEILNRLSYEIQKML